MKPFTETLAVDGVSGLDDPALAWDAYGVLQNFIPGLEALVSGTVAELLIDQNMVDKALDMWSRIAAAASPELASAFNAELARHNNLENLVGVSFDQWAETIGVTTPGQLEPIFSDGFE